MPIYEYRCEACGHELEALQKISDKVLTDCPACGQSALKKLVSAAGFRLTGSGWYETDFKDSKQKNLSTGSETTQGVTGGDKGSSSQSKDTTGGAEVKKQIPPVSKPASQKPTDKD